MAEDQNRKANYLWRQRKPISGTLAERYLRGVRGYNAVIPATLAFLPPSKPEHHPALIAARVIASEPEPGILAVRDADVRAIHLTFLNPDGSGKADVEPNKIMLGGAPGIPIMLAPPNDLLGLAITEGIEDGLSTYEATGLGAWAAGSTSMMPGLANTVPDYIDCVSIMAHPEPAGRQKAAMLADLLKARGFACKVIIFGRLQS